MIGKLAHRNRIHEIVQEQTRLKNTYGEKINDIVKEKIGKNAISINMKQFNKIYKADDDVKS